MFSINANTMYSIDEDGKHSLEISYRDSDGINVGVCSEGEDFEEVVFDALDQIDEAIAEYDNDKADVEEAKALQNEISKLQAQIAELQARNEELEKRHAKKLNHKPILDNDLKAFLDGFRKNDPVAGINKISDFPFSSKWWA